MNWVISILIGTIFFVICQICLRKSFEFNNTILQTFLLFTSTIGVFTIPFLFKNNLEKSQNWVFPILAGIFFLLEIIFGSKQLVPKNLWD